MGGTAVGDNCRFCFMVGKRKRLFWFDFTSVSAYYDSKAMEIKVSKMTTAGATEREIEEPRAEEVRRIVTEGFAGDRTMGGLEQEIEEMMAFADRTGSEEIMVPVEVLTLALSAIRTPPAGEAWTRQDLAEGLAMLDDVKLQRIASSVGPEEDANNWREYLGRADDLLVHLSICHTLASPAPVSVEVKGLEWVKSATDDTLSRAETIIGVYRVWTYFEAPGWFWNTNLDGTSAGPFKDEDAAKDAVFLHYRAAILPALSHGEPK